MKTKGLTLKEALESGKPFRRANIVMDWWSPSEYHVEHYSWTGAYILASDYEIKVEPREWDVYVGSSHDVISGRQFPGVLWQVKSIRVREILE